MFFLIPYFWIVGFDNGDVAAKFFWYWLFQGLYMAALVFIGHALAAALPNAATAQGTPPLTVLHLFFCCCFYLFLLLLSCQRSGRWDDFHVYLSLLRVHDHPE